MRCRSPTPSEYFIFKKEGFVLDFGKPYEFTEQMAEFHIAKLQQNDGGHYTCESYSKWPSGTRTQPSDALLLLVTEPPDTMTERYTMGNLIRFGVAAVIVLIMGGFLVEAWRNQRLSPNRP
ncbi:hypothetical protein STEG23_022484, partial [Scotinomys teguina]